MRGGATRVTHVITGLEVGGAEVILQRLLERVDRERFPSTAISLTGRGPLGERIEASGVPVVPLELRRLPGPIGIARLGRAMRAGDPEVIQTWLLHANVLAGGLARSRRIAPVAWSMHMTAAEAKVHGRLAVGLQRLEARLSRSVPARIASCSYSTYELMDRSGYDLAAAEVIPNGFDVDALRPNAEARATVRAELGIDPDAPVVAHAARFHPMKDHANLLAAAARVLEARPDARFLLCGTGVEESNPGLASLAAPLGEAVRLLGRRDDVTRIFQAADLATLSSAAGEAMPLVIGEAMACGLPFVATDCGDSAELIGETGRVVPIRRSDLLADALLDVISLPVGELESLGAAARSRIAERYSLSEMVAGYERLWDELGSLNRSS
jgi:glycosyltransferase involved in cell wall biosynthesis